MDTSAATDEHLYPSALLTLYVICPLTVLPLLFLVAPYGRHSRPGWGPFLRPWLAWILMESPTLWLTVLLYPLGRHRLHPLSLTLIAPFLLHYANRTVIYPLRLRRNSRTHPATAGGGGGGGGFPIPVAVCAFAFNILNAYVQARSVSHFSDYSGPPVPRWVWARVVVGVAVFAWGMAVNVRSDLALLRLKEQGGYRVPRGGWFEAVSCPNYMGEAAEWLGWAVMCWSPAALGFFLYTCSNLVPRAVANRRWYAEKFGDEYPKTRKAIIPYIF